jgi:translocation and assembly module TamA
VPGSPSRRAPFLAALAVLATSVVPGPAPAAPPGPEGIEEGAPSPIVTALELEGVRRISADDLREKLATQVSDRAPRVPIAGPVLHSLERAIGQVTIYRLDPDALAVDRRRIEAYYRARGFYAVQVAEPRVEPVARDQVKVVFRIDEGEPIRVGQVEVTGLEEAPEARQRAGRLPIREGDVFTESAFDAARGAMISALRNTGWANAEVEQQAQILPEAHRAIVRYTVKAGPRFRFGPIFVAGSSAVPRDRIREQAGIEIRSGRWFEEDKLAHAQARVFDLGVFGGVRVTRGTADPQRGIVPVVVAVREAPFRTLRAGPGLGVQGGTRVDVNTMVGYTHRNFIGDLRKVSLDLRAGYAWLLSPPQKNAPVALGSIEFSQPGALTRLIDASIRLEVERGLEQAYDFWSERLRVGFPVRFAPRWTFVPSYNLEVYQLSSVAESLAPKAGGQGPELQSCQGTGTRAAVCLLSYLEQRLGWDGRNDPVNTRRGLYVSVAVQEGFELGGYGYRYFRVVPEARAFLPLGPRATLAVRGRFGALIPIKQDEPPPIIARFSAGGPQSMRGYYSGRLSPMIFRDGEWIPVGGNGLADGSVELRFDLAGSWGAAVFVDAGNVSTPSEVPSAYQTVLDPTQLQWAAGLGLRYKTGFGPLRVDVGVRLPTDWSAGVPFGKRFPSVPVEGAGPVVNDEGEIINVIPNEHREPIVGVHITIGEAF